jgi:hypothetical protein
MNQGFRIRAIKKFLRWMLGNPVIWTAKRYVSVRSKQACRRILAELDFDSLSNEQALRALRFAEALRRDYQETLSYFSITNPDATVDIVVSSDFGDIRKLHHFSQLA